MSDLIDWNVDLFMFLIEGIRFGTQKVWQLNLALATLCTVDRNILLTENKMLCFLIESVENLFPFVWRNWKMTENYSLTPSVTDANFSSRCLKREGYWIFGICDVLAQGTQIRQIWRILRQNRSGDSTEVAEGVTLTPKVFGNKQGASSTPEIFGNKRSFVLTFFASKYNLR